MKTVLLTHTADEASVYCKVQGLVPESIYIVHTIAGLLTVIRDSARPKVMVAQDFPLTEHIQTNLRQRNAQVERIEIPLGVTS